MRRMNELDWKRLEKGFEKVRYHVRCDDCEIGMKEREAVIDCDRCKFYPDQSFDLPPQKINPTVLEALLSLKKQIDEIREVQK